MKSVKNLIEGITILGAILLASGIESNLLCGVGSVLLLELFRQEIRLWEGGV